MASLTRKILKGRAYYYLRECKWVDGKPKIVSQKYLGPADKVVERLARGLDSTPVRPQTIRTRQFGAVAALLGLIRELKVIPLIDKHARSRSSQRELSIGTFLALAVINRCAGACSKSKIADWFAGTALPRFLPLKPAQLTSQRFWDKMDRLTPDMLKAIDREFTENIIKKFRLEPSSLFYDATNFFTFIDSFNSRPGLAQRGHCKHGRDNLRILGLALLVTRGDQIPLLHHLYPGNQHDAVTFRGLLDELVNRYRMFVRNVEDITVVFDKGNNAQDIIERLDGETPYHFVGSLVPTQHPELLDIRRDQMKRLDAKRLPGVRAYRTTKEVFGAKRTVVVTYNKKLFRAQVKTLTRELTQRLKKLHALDRRLDRWHQGFGRGRKPAVASTQKAVENILVGRHMKDLIQASVSQGKGDLPSVSYSLNRAAWVHLKQTLLGKTLIFSDRDAWTDEDIVEAYRGQAHVEAAFRQMKDPHFVSFRPIHHWTDQKLQVHAFYSVLALTLCALLRKRLRDQGIGLSIPRMLAKLRDIREATLIYPAEQGGAPTVQTQIEELDPLQQQIYAALDLEKFAA